MTRRLNNVFPGSNHKPALISILIPVYNESRTIGPLVKALSEVQWPKPVEWVFINDASTDNSLAIIERLRAKHKQIRIINLKKNRGKSGAIAVGIENARGDILVVQDADLEYVPSELPKLIRPILRNQADVVYGSRFKKNVKQVHRTYHRYVNVLLTTLSNLSSGIYLSDMETCYKVFRADIMKSFEIRSERFGFEPEITAYIAKFNLRILELPISYFPRTRREGKKIRAFDGLMALWYIFKFNFLTSPTKCLNQTALERLEETPEDRFLKAG